MPAAPAASVPPDMAPIEIRNLSKWFGPVHAVRDLSFDVEPGRVTGFLGPNGAGKSTTLRMLLGLIRPTGGDATIDGRHYDRLDDPTGRVGAMLEDTSFHPGPLGPRPPARPGRRRRPPDARGSTS